MPLRCVVQFKQQLPFFPPRLLVSLKERKHIQHIIAFIAQAGLCLDPPLSVPEKAVRTDFGNNTIKKLILYASYLTIIL